MNAFSFIKTQMNETAFTSVNPAQKRETRGPGWRQAGLRGPGSRALAPGPRQSQAQKLTCHNIDMDPPPVGRTVKGG